MILTTPRGDFPIPADVARRLPPVPVDVTGRLAGPDARKLEDWLQVSPENAIAFERLRRRHLVQEELAGRALGSGQPFEVTGDGLD